MVELENAAWLPGTVLDGGGSPRSAAQPSCCWTRSIICPTGQLASKDNGTACAVVICRCVVATGSSALRVATGSRESLAGRFERMTLSHWPAAALANTFHLSEQDAALSLVQFGSYPGAMEFRTDPARWRFYVKDAIIEPAIGRDVLALGAVRRPALLRQVFAIATAAPAQIVSLQKLQGQLQDKGALETVAHYLTMLQEAYLVAPLEKFATRAHRRRSAPPKLVTLNNALLSAMHPSGPPDPAKEPARFGA
jgi:predicted AAA+ superfamily ATPase